MEVGVVGARKRNTHQDKQLIKEIIVSQMRKYQIHLVSGGCPKGADKFAEELADELQLGISIHYPDIKRPCETWEYAKACYERNSLIANECDILIALPGDSGGTWDTIRKVEKQGKPLIIR